jgi:hypothetical protein
VCAKVEDLDLVGAVKELRGPLPLPLHCRPAECASALLGLILTSSSSLLSSQVLEGA